MIRRIVVPMTSHNLSQLPHQTFAVRTGTNFVVSVCDFARFSCTGTISVAPVRTSIVLCVNRDNMPIPESALFCHFRFPGRSSAGIKMSRFVKIGQNHEPGQRNLARFLHQTFAVRTGTKLIPIKAFTTQSSVAVRHSMYQIPASVMATPCAHSKKHNGPARN